MSALTIAVRGATTALDTRALRVLFDRSSAAAPDVRGRTAEIIARVRAAGDTALLAYAQEFDGAALNALEVPRAAWWAALDALDAPLRRALERAAENIRQVHAAFLPQPSEVITADGAIIGRRPDPLARVGVYAPGGRAAYPSSLLMGVIPARVAGVGEIIVCSPPGADGSPSRVVLAAAALAGADRLFAVGGAGAIAALAYGTASIPTVDRIVGPGNAFVAEAKAQVASVVAIDSPAGPSELLVIADASASADVVARELLAQAEHDPLAAVVLVSTDAELLARVEARLAEWLPRAARAEIAAAALAARGALLLAPSLDHAVAVANRWAPEHLLIATQSPDDVLPQICNAGTVFVGESASVAFGDYLSGANHVLPTGGLSRAYSGLSTVDFCRWTTWQKISPDTAARLAADVGVFADAEGLPAHADAARQWLRDAQ
jgi:histidinol dehydrogenase